MSNGRKTSPQYVLECTTVFKCLTQTNYLRITVEGPKTDEINNWFEKMISCIHINMFSGFSADYM